MEALEQSPRERLGQGKSLAKISPKTFTEGVGLIQCLFTTTKNRSTLIKNWTLAVSGKIICSVEEIDINLSLSQGSKEDISFTRFLFPILWTNLGNSILFFFLVCMCIFFFSSRLVPHLYFSSLPIMLKNRRRKFLFSDEEKFYVQAT